MSILETPWCKLKSIYDQMIQIVIQPDLTMITNLSGQQCLSLYS